MSAPGRWAPAALGVVPGVVPGVVLGAVLGAALIVVLGGAPGEAVAHAFLQDAAPGVGSVVRQPPGEVAITFTEAVEPRFSAIAVTAESGARVDGGGAHPEGDGRRLAVALRGLAPGHYTVVWHALSVDGHKTEGRFGFTLRP